MTEDLSVKLKIGPKEGTDYPVSVLYCGNCTMPVEVSGDYLRKFFVNE